MMEPRSVASCEALAIQLLELLEAQQRALEVGDVDEFARLVVERGRVQEALGAVAAQVTAGPDRLGLQRFLDRAATMDRAIAVSARRLLEELSEELREMRRGRHALQGYGRNGGATGIRSAFLDTLG
jgi:hypothetical protein